jgi:hypothetical protein
MVSKNYPHQCRQRAHSGSVISSVLFFFRGANPFLSIITQELAGPGLMGNSLDVTQTGNNLHAFG